MFVLYLNNLGEKLQFTPTPTFIFKSFNRENKEPIKMTKYLNNVPIKNEKTLNVWCYVRCLNMYLTTNKDYKYLISMVKG